MNIDLDIETARWEAVIADVEQLVEETLRAAASLSQKADVSVILADNNRLHALNRDWRAKDKPTDVLSFPADPVFAPFVGDIAISLDLAIDDAEKMQKTLPDHTRHLLIHGYLHLLGYDHQTDTDANEMETLERQVLASLGVSDPYSLKPD